MTLRKRILIAMAAPALCLGVAVAGLHLAHQRVHHFAERADWAASQADTLERIVLDLDAMLISLLITSDAAALAGMLDGFERDAMQRLGVLENQTAMELSFVQGEERDEEEPERERPTVLRAQIEHVLEQMHLLLRIRMSADPMVDRSADLSTLMNGYRSLEESLRDALADEAEEIAEARALSRLWGLRAYWFVIGGTLLSLVLGTVLAQALVRDLVRRIAQLDALVTENTPLPRSPTKADELEGFASRLTGRLARNSQEVRETRDALTDMAARLERRSSELELSNARLREIDQTRRRFLGDIGHALKTPLAVARGSVENLGPGLGSDGTSSLQRALQAIDAVTARVTTLVSLARSDDGRVIGQQTTVELYEFLDSRLGALRIMPGGDRLELTSHLEMPLEITCDPLDLERLCDAVLENALDHGDGPVTVTLSRQPDSAVITVHDNGPGLGGLDADTLFERYRSERGGHGIGLAMARQITQELGGDIAVKAPEDGGLLVVIRLGLPNDETGSDT